MFESLPPRPTSSVKASFPQAWGVEVGDVAHGGREDLERHHAPAEGGQAEPEEEAHGDGLLLVCEGRAEEHASTRADEAEDEEQ